MSAARDVRSIHQRSNCHGTHTHRVGPPRRDDSLPPPLSFPPSPLLDSPCSPPRRQISAPAHSPARHRPRRRGRGPTTPLDRRRSRPRRRRRRGWRRRRRRGCLVVRSRRRSRAQHRRRDTRTRPAAAAAGACAAPGGVAATIRCPQPRRGCRGPAGGGDWAAPAGREAGGGESRRDGAGGGAGGCGDRGRGLARAAVRSVCVCVCVRVCVCVCERERERETMSVLMCVRLCLNICNFSPPLSVRACMCVDLSCAGVYGREHVHLLRARLRRAREKEREIESK